VSRPLSEGVRAVLRLALRVMMGTDLPRRVEAKEQGKEKEHGKVKWRGYVSGRRKIEQMPALWLEPTEFKGTAVVWIDPPGKARLVEMMLPGALKYGGLPALAALAAPGELLVHNILGSGSGKWLKVVYKAAGAEKKLERSSGRMADDKVVAWLLR
jgi:hypothetical protein